MTAEVLEFRPPTKEEMEEAEHFVWMKRVFLPELERHAKSWKYLLDEAEWGGGRMQIEDALLLRRESLGEIELLWHLSSPAARERIIARMVPVMKAIKANEAKAEEHIRKHAERKHAERAKGAQ
jgi:hypothetical protein